MPGKTLPGPPFPGAISHFIVAAHQSITKILDNVLSLDD
uniref:Uncharacterized protein n=1 Tax=Anguilla anguilla TaxID=7936 RepID=A0A0E9TYT1_ANGAN